MGVETNLRWQGAKELERALLLLPERLQRKVMRKANRKAATPIVRHAKSIARQTKTRKRLRTRSGQLAKSIGQVTRSYPATQTIVTAIGARHGFKKQVGTTRDGRAVYENPALIAHLVEFGHRIVVGGTTGRQKPRIGRTHLTARSRRSGMRGEGRVVGFAAPQPFLRPAYESNKRRSMAIYRRVLGEGIEQEARKLAKT